MMLSLKCYGSHWKVKKVFLNVQNIRADNFNLVKSLRNTCKWFYFFTLKWTLTKILFQNITHYISKILPSSNNTVLRDTSHSFCVSSLVSSYTVVQFCRFKTNKTLNKCFKFIMKLKKLELHFLWENNSFSKIKNSWSYHGIIIYFNHKNK